MRDWKGTECEAKGAGGLTCTTPALILSAGRHKIVIGGEIEDEVDGANAAQPMDLEGPVAVAGRHSEG